MAGSKAARPNEALPQELPLAAFGVALTAGDVAALFGLAFVFASLWRKALVEERLLAAEFGEEYTIYSRHTKRLIPFVL